MSFASELKDELALNEAKYEKDELSALFKTLASISMKDRKWAITFKTENAKVATKAFRKISKLYNIKPITSIYKSMKLNKNNVYYLSIEDKVNEIISDLNLMDDENIKNIIRSDARINSYLSGVFMAVGSVNSPTSSNYHLEMAVVNEDFANIINRLMQKTNLNTKIIKRRNLYVVYLKKAQDIADFIVRIGGNNAYFKFEDYRINRDFYNSDNRLNNCEIANSVRTNLAANTQIEYIKEIDEKIGIKMLDKNLACLAKLRLENPEDSLTEIANKYNEINETNYTKSGINHLFEKIKNVSIELKAGKKK